MANRGTGGLGDLGHLKELRQRIFFLLGALIVYRIGTFVPVPGVDPTAFAVLYSQQEGTILDMFNMFSGGALERASLFALGIMPYISASIIMQLMSAVVPSLEQLKKEGEAGRRKITQYTRYGTVILGVFQSVGIAIALQGQTAGGENVVVTQGIGFVVIATVALVTGTMFLMWLGEQITERGLGNGISIIIFAGIVAGLPSAIGATFERVSSGEMNPLVLIALLIGVIAVTAFVVFVERGRAVFCRSSSICRVLFRRSLPRASSCFPRPWGRCSAAMRTCAGCRKSVRLSRVASRSTLSLSPQRSFSSAFSTRQLCSIPVKRQTT